MYWLLCRRKYGWWCQLILQWCWGFFHCRDRDYDSWWVKGRPLLINNVHLILDHVYPSLCKKNFNYFTNLSCISLLSRTNINYFTNLSCISLLSRTNINYLTNLSCMSLLSRTNINYLTNLSCISLLSRTRLLHTWMQQTLSFKELVYMVPTSHSVYI